MWSFALVPLVWSAFARVSADGEAAEHVQQHPLEIWEATESHFAVLGLEPDAEAAACKRAYRVAAMKYHPDKCNQGRGVPGLTCDEHAAQFQAIQAANEVLSDDSERAKHARTVRGRGSAPRRQPRAPPTRRTHEWSKPAPQAPRTQPRSTPYQNAGAGQKERPAPRPAGLACKKHDDCAFDQFCSPRSETCEAWPTWTDIFGTKHFTPLPDNTEGGYWDTNNQWHREWFGRVWFGQEREIHGGWTDAHGTWNEEWWTYDAEGNKNAWHSQATIRGTVYWQSNYADGTWKEGSYQAAEGAPSARPEQARYARRADAEYARAAENARRKRAERAAPPPPATDFAKAPRYRRAGAVRTEGTQLKVGDSVQFKQDGAQRFGKVETLGRTTVGVKSMGNVVQVEKADVKKI